MKIISIIPARGGSKGIHMKNIVTLKNKPLLFYSINSSLQSKMITKTIVSTDNKKIAKVAKKLGAKVINRPKKLSQDKSQIEPAISHVLDYLEKKDGYKPDVIVLLQNTSPLRTAKHIDDAVKIFLKKKYSSMLSAYPSHSFLWKKEGNKVIPLNYNPQKRPRRQQMTAQFIENGAIYITKFTSFKKSKCRVSGRIGLYVMPKELSIDIDSYNDLKLARQLMDNAR